MQVGFVGLGIMGSPMARHLARVYSVIVYNRTYAKAEQWAAQEHPNRVSVAKTPRELAAICDVICLCVGDDADVLDVITGDQGLLKGARPGSVIVDHTTTSADLARNLAERCRQTNVAFLDAPVSGGQKGAEDGRLAVMCGGDRQTFDRVYPVLSVYGQIVAYIGSSGSGQLAKMVNQIAIAGLLQGLSEALNFGRAAGLDMDTVLSVIQKGAARSWQMENRGHTMLQDSFNFGFKSTWMLKDLGHCLHQAHSLDTPLPVASLVHSYYQELVQRGWGECDTSALIRRLAHPQH